jgi:phosphogluconate dehydratase
VEWSRRKPAEPGAEWLETHAHDLGRDLFAGMRRNVLTAEEGAVTWL